MPGSVAFGGLMSGLDTAGLIDKLINAESRSIIFMQKQQIDLDNKKGVLQDLKTKFTQVKTAAFDLTPTSLFQSYRASSSNSAVIEATVASTSSVQTGAVNISDITSMATFQRQVFSVAAGLSGVSTSMGFSDGETVTIDSNTYNVPDVTINVDSTTTMQDLVDDINNATGNTLVTASYLNVSSNPASPNYQLVLKAKNTGLSNYAGANNRGFDADEINTKSTLIDTIDNQEGTDAVLKIDGVSVSRSTNTFENVLNGLSFTLKDVPTAGSEVNVTVAEDVNAVGSKVAALVSNYNSLNAVLHQQFEYNPEAKTLGILGSDSSVKVMQKTIQSYFTGYAQGLRPGSNGVTGFADIGFSTDKDSGAISFDQAKFTAKYASNKEEVKALFLKTHSVNGIATKGIAQSIYEYTSGLVSSFNDPVNAKVHASIIDEKINSMTKTTEMIDKRILKEQSRLQAVRETMTQKFNAMEQLLSTLQSQGNAVAAYFGAGKK